MDKTGDIQQPLAAFAPIGHAFFAKDGVKLAFGRRWDGELIHISQAARGAACGCTCPAQDCRRRLVARKPDTAIAHHFSHAPLTQAEREAGVSPNCRYASMTILHAYAEKLLNEKKALVLPPVGATLGKRSRIRRSAKEYSFDAAKLETMDGETVPDVILYKGEHRMHVEIYVTHRVDDAKRAKIIAAGIAAIEIDLSGVDRDSTVAVVDDAILRAAPREWIYNRKAQEALQQLQSEADAEAEATNRLRQKAAADLASAYRRARELALASDWKNAEDVIKVVERGDEGLLNRTSKAAGYFTVHPKVWMAAVLNLLHDRFWHSSSSSMASELARQGWLVDRFRTQDNHIEDLLEAADMPSGGAVQAIEDFLRHLARGHVVTDEGWRWSYTQQHAGELDRRLREKQRLACETIERSSRHRRLKELVSDIVEIGNSAKATSFDFGAWLGTPIGDAGPTVQQIADAGDAAWHDLHKALKITCAVLKDETEQQAEAFGLPVEDALRTMRAAHDDRATQRKREAEEKAQQESSSRIIALSQDAQRQLGDTADAWLGTPFQKLGDLTPKQAAADSSAMLEAARQVLNQVVEARAAKERWEGELEREVTGLLRRLDTDPERLKTKVTLYMNTSDPNLPHRVSPRVHTKDDRTMQDCLVLLRQRIGKR